MASLSTLLGQIDTRSMVLPEFQRGYVWNRGQVRALMRSLYLHYPVGGLLVWETEPHADDLKGANDITSGTKSLLLDGQQRMTTLYGVMRGRAPEFFEGDQSAFLDLHFNVDDESFEFYAPNKMKADLTWISCTSLFTQGLEPLIEQFNSGPHAERVSNYLAKLARLQNIANRDFHIEKIVGEDKTIDVVVDIFNRVNSGGTKLSKGDLALAKIASSRPDTRQRMRDALQTWDDRGYHFTMDWLLRNVTAVATGKAKFSFLEQVSSDQFDQALHKTVNYVDTALNLLAARLGLDHGKVLISRYALPVLTRYLHLHGGNFPNKSEQDKALYWYVQAGLWGRFSSSIESKLQQDYDTLENTGLDGIIEGLARTRGGSLTINPVDFTGYSMGSRFYPMLYLMTRVLHARDFCTGTELSQHLLGKLSSLQVHHTFPKKQLYDDGRTRGEVNAVANFVFLTQECNLKISDSPPSEYFPQIITAGHKSSLESQWIPMDEDLWQLSRYPDFLAARRELLAAAANNFLESLLKGAMDLQELPHSQPVIDAEDDRPAVILDLVQQLAEYGVAEPEIDEEIWDGAHLVGVAEAYWSEGLQPGRGKPTILELDHDTTDIEHLQALGYAVFTSPEALLQFVRYEAAREEAGEPNEA